MPMSTGGRSLLLAFLLLWILMLPAPKLKAANQDSLRIAISEHPADSLGADALILLARSYFGSDLDSSIYIGEQAKALCLSLEDDELVARAENALGIARLFQGNNDASLVHFEEVLRIREKQGDKGMISKAYNNVALSHQELGNYSLALDHHFSSLRIKEELKDTASILVSFVNIGLIYHKLKDYPSARRYYGYSFDMLELEKDSTTYGTNAYNIGSTYFNEQRHDSARYWFELSFPIVMGLGDQRMIGLHYLNLGQIDQADGHLDKSEESIAHALEIFSDLGKLDQVVAAQIALGKNYQLKNDPRMASKHCGEAYDQTVVLKDLNKRADCLECLHTAYAELGLSELAYKSLLEHSQIEDSLGVEDIHRQIVRKDLEYSFTKKQLADSLEAARQGELITMQYENDQERLRSFTVFLVIIGALLLGLVLLLVFILRNKQKQKDFLEDRVRDRTAELERQKNQLAEYAFINAHLMRQPLTQIMGLIPLIQMADTEKERDQYLGFLEASSKKLDDVIHEVRDIVEQQDQNKNTPTE